MNKLDSIKAQLPQFAVLSEQQSVFTKGGEDKREPRSSSQAVVHAKSITSTHGHSIEHGKSVTCSNHGKKMGYIHL